MRNEFAHCATPTQPRTGVTAALIKEINYRPQGESLDSIQRESRAPAAPSNPQPPPRQYP
jgi:hypothetical protein